MDTVRTCIGCRERAQASSLLRVVARGGEVIPDPSATLPGRGAWVHPAVPCIDLAVKRRAFGRALKVTGMLDTDQVLIAVTESSTDEMAD